MRMMSLHENGLVGSRWAGRTKAPVHDWQLTGLALVTLVPMTQAALCSAASSSRDSVSQSLSVFNCCFPRRGLNPRVSSQPALNKNTLSNGDSVLVCSSQRDARLRIREAFVCGYKQICRIQFVPCQFTQTTVGNPQLGPMLPSS